MQTPQRLDATHGGELFPVDDSCSAGPHSRYAGFISRADAEFVARMI
jgi:hypothetical protein